MSISSPTPSTPAVGGLLLCQATPFAVRPTAHALRVPLRLAPAGSWSVLVPEDLPWQGPEADAPTVADAFDGWAPALTVGAGWPVIGVWWDGGRTGFVSALGFRRAVSFGWEADGTPVGDPDVMRVLAARIGLDPVLDLEVLERLTRPDENADGPARLLGLLALLTRAGLALPPGLAPDTPMGALREAARSAPGAEAVTWSGWREAVHTELDVLEAGPLGPWLRGPRARALGIAQVAAAVPLLAWAGRRRNTAWLTTGGVLLAHGALSLAYDRARTRAHES
ncbi:hypothetical protein ACN20G_06845 [Streptomyces sp. BI20]|uniref:hypothetical protein n=1 Tax=Streptomyces sp. BI20 TaxID=3403460 RepID=UPI003C73D2EF